MLLAAYAPLLGLMLLTNIYEEEARFPKAAAFMVAIGYPRKAQMMARYFLAIAVFLCCMLIYWGETFLVQNLLTPTTIDIIAAFFAFSVFMSLFLFTTTKYGLKAGKYILFSLILLVSLGPTFLVRLPISINWDFFLQFSKMQWSVALLVLAVLMIALSFMAAVQAYEQKEL